MFNLQKNQAVNIEEVELIERNNQIVVDACNGWKNTDEKPNLLIFDLIFKLNLGQSQQQPQFRDIKILVCSNVYNVFGFQMLIKDLIAN